MARSTLLILVGSLGALALLIWMVANPPGNESGSDEAVTLFCAASNRAVMEEIREDFEKETGRKVSIQYGPSQTLLTQMEVAKSVDLYLPADDSFLDLAENKGLLGERLPLARMQVGLVVPKGNPAKVTSLQDAIDKGLRIVQANPDASAVAKLTRNTLARQDCGMP